MRRGGVAFCALVIAACGHSRLPTSPTHGPVTNLPPVINSITLSVGPRTEVDTDVTITADVTDPDTPVSEMVFAWSSNVGSFTGAGSTVTWRLPKGTASTPLDVHITLQVSEQFTNYDTGGNPFVATNSVSASAPPLRVHDSVTEISTIAVHFLVDLFGNSNVSPEACVVDFWDGCPGKNQELGEIENNRDTREVISADAQVSSVVFDRDMTHAAVIAPCSFHDRDLVTGEPGDSFGDCELSAQYHDGRWWLCVSTFCGHDNEPCPAIDPGAETERRNGISVFR